MAREFSHRGVRYYLAVYGLYALVFGTLISGFVQPAWNEWLRYGWGALIAYVVFRVLRPGDDEALLRERVAKANRRGGYDLAALEKHRAARDAAYRREAMLQSAEAAQREAEEVARDGCEVWLDERHRRR